MEVRKYTAADVPAMTAIWNEVVTDGIAFPQTECLTDKTGAQFFAAQSHCGIAVEDGAIVGMYILHPNNVGRCGHISNASYAVSSACRGKGAGEALVRDCIAQAAAIGFRIIQFNAVVRTNTPARHLYEKLGFTPLGIIPHGFLMKDGHYEDIVPYYLELV